MKKILSIFVFICILSTSVIATDGVKEYKSDGGIYYKDNIYGTSKGEIVTLLVVKNDFDWQDYNDWMNNTSGENILFCGETTIGDKGEYLFEFSLNESGCYKTIVGTELNVNVEENKLFFVNEENNKAKLEALLEDDADFLNIVTNNRYDLALFDDLYDKTDLVKAATIFSASEKSSENVAEVLHKSLMASALNNGLIGDISLYEYCFDNKPFTYVSDDLVAELTNSITRQNFITTKQLDDKFLANTILLNVNANDGVENLKNTLLYFSDDIGINKDKVTTSLCSKICSQEKKFESIEELTEYIAEFKPDKEPSNGGGGGGASGGSSISTNSNSLVGTDYVIGSDKTQVEENQSNFFDDLADYEWAKEAINSLYYREIIDGVSPRTFEPGNKVKREEASKMITSAYGYNLSGDDLKFTDVSQDAWYYKYIKTAYISGIVTGMTDDIFGVGIDITREDLCVMIDRALTIGEFEFNSDGLDISFTDDAEISVYAKDAVKKLSRAGFISGYGDGKFNPKGTATRAEIAKIIYNTLVAID